MFYVIYSNSARIEEHSREEFDKLYKKENGWYRENANAFDTKEGAVEFLNGLDLTKGPGLLRADFT